MFSVTSDVAVSAPLQVAPSKPALPDAGAQASSDFGALVDSNLQAAAPPPSPAPSAPPRSAVSDNPPPANNPPPSDATASGNGQPANNDNPRPTSWGQNQKVLEWISRLTHGGPESYGDTFHHNKLSVEVASGTPPCENSKWINPHRRDTQAA